MPFPTTAVLQQDGPAPLTSHRKPLPALTGVRFVAAMLVVFHHFGATFALRHSYTRLLGRFLANGWIAVSFFFILSGFILSYTYSGQISGAGGKRRFWEARFARIYPIYLLSLMLMLPFQKELSLSVRAAVVLMVQSWNPLYPELSGAWNSPAWTLSIEAFFYLLFPFILVPLLSASLSKLKVLVALSVPLVVFGHTNTRFIEALSPKWLIPMPIFRLPEFFLGMVLGLLFIRSGSTRRSPIRVYAALVATIAILLFTREQWLSLIVIPYAVLIYELAIGTSGVARLLGSKTFVLLGGASYAVYLLQLPVRSIVHFAVTGDRNLLENHSGIDAALSPVVLVAISIVTFLYWEEPWRRWLRDWFKRRIEPRGSSTTRRANEA